MSETNPQQIDSEGDQFAEGKRLIALDQNNPERKEIIDRIQALRGKAVEDAGKNDWTLYNKQNNFALELGNEPNIRTYRVYHYIVGSTPFAGCDEFDLSKGKTIAERFFAI